MYKSVIVSAIAATVFLTHASAQDQAISSDRDALRSMARRFEMSYVVQAGTTSILSNELVSLAFELGSRKFVYGNTLIWLNDPLIREGSDQTLARTDVIRIVEPLLNPARTLTNQDVTTIVIDPGHGGTDTGALGIRHEHEKKIVLDIAKRTRKRLQVSGVNVKLTREKDQAVELADRSARGKKWGADLFVSIHINSARNRHAAGLETYLMPAAGFPSTSGNTSNVAACPGNKFDASNTLLAYYVHRSIVFKTGCADRGIRHARFDVLKEASCPAILVECGFVSNGPEEDLLLQKEYRDSLADGIAAGIMEYVNGSRNK
ncbi:MAG: hypothetical protein C0404_07300 [Verrucomicrobia bacterium]|nr:hypothetical protein [Verrucomicrobiota bacterium]